MSSSLADVVTELPYPGLRPFEQHEADIFFGRKRHVTDLLKRLNSRRFLAVVGPSGCGKSSLIRAGLIPALQAGFMARSKFQWSFAVLRPGNQPLLRLATALWDSGVFGDPASDSAPDPKELRADLDAGSRSLANRLILNEFAQGTNLLILVDQFEELFRFEKDGGGDESRAFVNLLLETSRDTEVSAYIVITMRTDFLGHCPVFAGLPEALNDSQYLTPRLTRDQIESAVVGPARVFGGEVDADVVALILNEMGTDPDQLPLMQHLLMRMWRRAVRTGLLETDSDLSHGSTPTSSNAQLTMDDYTVMGGLPRALSHHVETIFLARLRTERERELAQMMFRRLTGVAPSGQLIRRSPPPEFSTLCDKLGIVDGSELRAVIDTFRREGRSFLMPPPAEELRPDTLIDISHESLIRKWPRLQEWTRDEAQTADIRRGIGKDAAAWDAGGRKSGDTAVPESRLVAALTWSESHHRDVSPQVHDFLEACIQRRDAARRTDQELAAARRNKRIAFGLASAFLALAATAGGLWIQSRQQGMQLSAASQNLQELNAYLRKSEELLKDAKDETDIALAKRYWRDAAQQFQGDATVAKGGDLAFGLMWLANAYSKEPKLDPKKEELYAIRFGAALAQHPTLRQLWHHDDLRAMAVSGDGRYVVTAGAGDQRGTYELRIWDADKPHSSSLWRLMCDHEINVVDFTGDGKDRYLLAATGNREGKHGELAVWRWPDSNQAPFRYDVPPLKFTPAVLSAAFVPSLSASKTPGFVAIVKRGSTTDVKLWRSPDKLPIDLQTIDAKAAPRTADTAAFTSLAVSRNGRFLAAWGAGADGRNNAFCFWNVANQTAIGGDGLASDLVARAAFSDDGNLLATVDRQGKARLWDTSTGKVMRAANREDAWTAHDGAATYVEFSPDGKRLITAGEDNVARLWDIELLDAIKRKHEFPHESRVVSARFSSDGHRVATASQDRTVRVWDANSGRSVAPPLHHAFSVSAAEFSADGQLLTRMRDTVQVWGLATENPPPITLQVGKSRMTNVVHSSNGKYVATFGTQGSRVEVRVWDVISGKRTHSELLPYDGTWIPTYACISDNGRHLLIVLEQIEDGLQRTVCQMWDDVGRRHVAELQSDKLGTVRCAAFSSDAKFVVTTSQPTLNSGLPWQVQVWNAESGEPLAVPTEQPGPVNHIAWSNRDDRIVISAGNATDQTEKHGGARLYEWKSQRLRASWTCQHSPPSDERQSNAVLFAAFSPNDALVATGGADDAAYLWSVADGSPRSPRLKHNSDIVQLTFSTDGKQLATTSIRDNKSCVWDVGRIQVNRASIDPKYTFQHHSRVNQAVFSANGKLLATLSNDSTARVWSMECGELAAAFKHDADVQTACIVGDEDESRLMTISYNASDVRRDLREIGVHLADRDQSLPDSLPNPWPQRWQWRLKLETALDPDQLQDHANLLAGSKIDPQHDVIQPLSSDPDAIIKELNRLWQANQTGPFASELHRRIPKP